MRKTIDILGVNIDMVTMDEAENRIWSFLKGNCLSKVFTPNSEIIMVAQKDPELKDVLNGSELNTADGIGVVHASRILGLPMKERVAGFDLARRVVSKLPESGHTLFLLGGAPGVADIAKENMERDYPGIRIVGTHDGYFDSQKEQAIIDMINEAKPDIVFVCLGMSKQEKWISRNQERLHAKVCMGIGGSLDVFAGKAERAPDIYIKFGIEWLYRLMKEPWRYKRMLALPQFAFTVFLKGKRQG